MITFFLYTNIVCGPTKASSITKNIIMHWSSFCLGFVCGLMGSIVIMDYEVSLKKKCSTMRRDLRLCLSQLEAIENYFSLNQDGQLNVHGRRGFLTFANGEYLGHTSYASLEI